MEDFLDLCEAIGDFFGAIGDLVSHLWRSVWDRLNERKETRTE
jgi:hypothetical protein